MTRDALLVATWQARDDIYIKLAAGMTVNQLLYYGVAMHALDRFVDDLIIACYESLIETLSEDVLRAATPVVIRNALERVKEQIRAERVAVSDQLELALADDYAESYEPGRPPCADCAHCDEGRPWRGWKTPSQCSVLRREVSRSTGRCGQFASRGQT